MTTETVDLFEHISSLPRDVQDVLAMYEAKHDEDDPYSLCRELLEDLEMLGYTFEYGLEGEPFNLKAMSTTVQKLTFEYRGQDFDEWYIRNGIVIDCQPGQGIYWVGTRVLYPDGPLKAKGDVYVRSAVNGKQIKMKYLADKVVVLSKDEAAKVESYGLRWAGIKGIPVSDLGLSESKS